jgi:4-hydroxymandelate oxidase
MDVLRQVRLEAGHRGEPLRGAYPGPGQPACYGPHMTKRLPDRAAAFLNAQQMPQMSRRRFLESLAAGTALSLGAMSARSQGITPIERPPDPTLWAPREILHVIADPSEALSVFDFEAAMMKKVSRAHFGYMATGIDDEATVRGNREGFQRFQLRPRRLVDVSSIDTSCEIFGVRYDSPIVIAPTGSNKAFHADGEVAVARAAKAGNHLQILSTVATTSIEDAIAARGAPVWFQLYPTERWEIGDALARRAEKAGCETIVLTVDTLGRQKWETYERLRRADIQQCGSCHAQGTYLSRKPNFDGLRLGVTASTISPNLTWEYVKRLRGVIRTRLVLKGILAAEDARLAVENGIDDRGTARGRRCGRGADTGADRQRLSARHGDREGSGDRRTRGVRRSTLFVGARLIRTSWCRSRLADPEKRDARGDAAGWRPYGQASGAGDGATPIGRLRLDWPQARKSAPRQRTCGNWLML